MTVVRLVPSAYTIKVSTASVLYPARMYDNTDDTTDYATLCSPEKKNSAIDIFIHGFDFTQVPSNAVVSSFVVKVRCYRSRYQRTGTSYNWRLASEPVTGSTTATPVIAGTTTSTAIETSASVIEIPTGNLTWATLKSYGTDLSLLITVCSSTSSSAYVYVYGAEIAVTYSLPAPVITVGNPSRTIISDESGFDQSTCTFRSDLALQAWEARATKAGTTPARGVGLLVESGTTLAANTDATVVVDDEELTNGDGEYTITVYGQSTGGVWSG